MKVDIRVWDSKRQTYHHPYPVCIVDGGTAGADWDDSGGWEVNPNYEVHVNLVDDLGSFKTINSKENK